MLLSKPVIERLIATKHITIDTFKPENLGSAQYDVTLGEHFYREKAPPRYCGRIGEERSERRLYNPFDENHVRNRWQLDQPIAHEDWIERTGVPLINVGLGEKLILLEPGEMILAHTEEFIGGSCDFITTKMYARSSSGRNGLEVCRCAGLGDVGYFTRWTMEIANTSRYDSIFIVPGRRIAQLTFFQVERVDPKDVYSKQGKYQDSDALDQLKAAWTPDAMIPKQWLDRESLAVPTQPHVARLRGEL
jgi:dCTP deaminase